MRGIEMGKPWNAALALLLLSPLLFAGVWDQCTPAEIVSNPSSPYNQSLGLIAIAVVLVLFLVSLAYMFGQSTHNEKLLVWSKDEAANLVVSVVLAAAVVGFFSVSCAVALGYTNENPYEISYDYLNDMVHNGLNLVSRLTKAGLKDQIKSTSFLYIGGIPFFGGIGWAYNANARTLSAQKDIVMDMVLPSIVSLRVQRFALEAAQSFGLMLLALAIFLRAIPLTRDIGNLFIALAFAVYVVFPFTYAINAMAVAKYPPALGVSASGSHDFALDGAGTGCEGTDRCALMIAGYMLPQAILFPNISIILVTASTTAVWKFLRAFTA
jgi:hypothetical protein